LREKWLKSFLKWLKNQGEKKKRITIARETLGIDLKVNGKLLESNERETIGIITN